MAGQAMPFFGRRLTKIIECKYPDCAGASADLPAAIHFPHQFRHCDILAAANLEQRVPNFWLKAHA